MSIEDMEQAVVEEDRLAGGKGGEPAGDDLEKGKPAAEESEDEDDFDEEEEKSDEEDAADYDEESEESDESEDEDEEAVESKRESLMRARTAARKSLTERLAEDEEAEEALELSGFLKSFAGHISDALDDAVAEIRKSVKAMIRKEVGNKLAELDPVVIAKSVKAEIEDKFAEQEELVKGLAGEVDGVARSPVESKMRRGAILHKGGGEGYSYSEKQQALMDAALEGLCSADLVARFDLDPTAISDEMVKSLKEGLELKKAGAGAPAR